MKTHKRMNTSRIAGVTLLASAVALALALGAAARPSAGGHGFGRMLDRLDLSDETRSNVEAVIERSRAEAQPLRDALEAERAALEALLAEDEVDADAALAQVELIGEARTALAKLRVNTGIEMRALMSDDEREAWDEAKARHKERRQRMRERRHGRFGHETGGSAGSEALAWDVATPTLP